MTGGRPDSARQAPTRSSEPRGLIEDFALLFQAVGLAKRRLLISLGLLMLWGAIAEVAAVVSYIRTSWGNKGTVVFPGEVGRFRGTAVE